MDFLRSSSSKVNVRGRSTDVDTTFRDIYDVTSVALWPAPTQARIHDIVSSNGGDAAAGAGARTVKIAGLTSWITGEESEIVTLNGTSPVPTTKSYVVINELRVLTKGSTDVNIGTIKATAQTDGTVTAQINPGAGRAASTIYGVPRDRTLHMSGVWADIVSTSGTIILRLAVNPEPDQELASFLNELDFTVGNSSKSSFRERFFKPYFGVPGPAIVKIQATGSTTNMDVAAGFDGFLTPG